MMNLTWPPISVDGLRTELATYLGDPPARASNQVSHVRTAELARGDGVIPVRIHEHPNPEGIFIHIHGGGFVAGSAGGQDVLLGEISRLSSLTVVSIDYRLAPEFRYPTAADDCEAAARWILDGESGIAGGWVAIGGESAGANLALVTALRLRDRPAERPLSAVSLICGCYDLTLTPSARRGVDVSGILTSAMLRWFFSQYVPEGVDLCSQDISPLYADLAALPPVHIVAGEGDALVDDSLFLHARLRVAGTRSDLHVVPGMGHGLESADVPPARLALAAAVAHLTRNMADKQLSPD